MTKIHRLRGFAEMGEKLTFWKLLGRYSIEIPVIQRDYAQGRDNAVDIRENFLESIKSALENDTDLDLNFVYGSVKNSLFIPIDGQQRLTTLFLLHVYVLLSLGKSMDSVPYNRIAKFTYETRTTSRDFCKNLTRGMLVMRNGKNLSQVDKISDEIINNNWFSSSWKYDPTIKSMLNMLDAIHNHFRDSNLERYFELLFSDEENGCPLYFYFLNLEDNKLDDSIYIKLNARGKDLTCYENFKAKLSKYLHDEMNPLPRDYIAELDGRWSDVFWTFREPETRLYDDKIMYFFINCMVNEYAAHLTTVGQDPVRQEIKEIIDYSQLEFINRFQGFTSKWDGHRVVDSFADIFDLFDMMTVESSQKIFAEGNRYFDEAGMFRWTMEKHDPEYEKRIQNDAYLSFLLENKNSINEPDIFRKRLVNWMRVITTLSRETNYNAGDDYVRAIKKGVRTLLPYSYDIITYLGGLKMTDFSGFGFDPDCFKEECLKAKLMCRDDEWKELILEAEGNRYFNGQIGFLLEAADIISQYEEGLIDQWTDEDDDRNKAEFRKYLKIYGSIFGEFVFNDVKYVGINRTFANSFRRALLCKGDYHLDKSYNSSFLIDFGRDISWKRLLRIQSSDKTGMFKKRRKMLFDLINDGLFDVDNIAGSLNAICNRDGAGITDWRRYFVTVPEIMDSLHDYSEGKQPRERFIRFEEGGNIFLMGRIRLYGYNDEYYSYALFCSINRSRYDVDDYVQAKGWEDVPYQIRITERTTGRIFEIKYQRNDKNFAVNENGTLTIFPDMEAVLAFLG